MKTNSITFWRRLLYGATLIGVSSLFLSTARAQEECKETEVPYDKNKIKECSQSDLSFTISTLYGLPQPGWGLSAITDLAGNPFPLDEDIVVKPDDKAHRFIFTFSHTSGKTCYINRDITVLTPPSLTLIDQDTIGCEGVFKKANPRADGDFHAISWTITPKNGITETEPAFTLPGVGTYTITATATKEGCSQQSKSASLSYKVLGKPQFDVAEDGQTYTFPKNNACKSCLITLNSAVDAINQTLTPSNARSMTGPLEITEAKITWDANPSPSNKLTTNTTFTGKYEAKVQSTNNCGTSTPKSITRPIQQQFEVEDCKPSFRSNDLLCPDDDFNITVTMPKGKIQEPSTTSQPAYKAFYNFVTSYTEQPTFTLANSGKHLGITIAKVKTGFSYSFEIPYQIACPHTSTPIQTATAPASLSPEIIPTRNVTLKSSGPCNFIYSYEYCTNGGKAVFAITAKDEKIKISDVAITNRDKLFRVIKTNKESQWRCESIDPISPSNKATYETLNVKVLYSSGDGKNFDATISLTPRNDCDPILGVEYRSRADYFDKDLGTFACAGDTMLVTVSVPQDSSVYELVGMDLPFGRYTSGDTTPFRRVYNEASNSLSYRFISYHYYAKYTPEMTPANDENIPVADSTMYFRVHYKDKISQTNKSTVLSQTIRVRTCPPSAITDKRHKFLEGQGYDIQAENPTTDSLSANLSFSAPCIVKETGYGTHKTTKALNLGIRVYPFKTMTATLQVWFNEGDSIRYRNMPVFQHLVSGNPPAIVASKPDACIGDMVEFSIDTSKWTSNTNKGVTFNWYTPSDIEFKRMDGNKVVFVTNNAQPGIYSDYLCKVGIHLQDKYIDSTLTFDLYPPVTFFVRGNSAIFKTDTIRVCDGRSVTLTDYINTTTGATISGYTQPTGAPLNAPYTFTAGNPHKGIWTAKVTYPNCSHNPYNQTAFMKVDAPMSISDIVYNIPCLGDTVKLSVSTTDGMVTWIRKKTDGSDDTLCRNCHTSIEVPTVADQDFVVVAKGANGCTSSTEKSKTVKPTPYPTILMTADTGACPNVPFDLKEKSGSAAGDYTLYDLRTGQVLTPTDIPTFSPTGGLTQFSFQAPYDSLLLCYTATNNNCAKSDSTRLTAYSLPTLQITPDVGIISNGKLCLPSGINELTLVADGAGATGEYTWHTTPATIARTLTLTTGLNQDQTIKLTGKEKQHNCSSELTIDCIVSVGRSSSSAAICPGDAVGACFEADNFPDASYDWKGPDGLVWKDPDNNPVQGFKACGATKSGTYTLNASRNGCSSSYRYTLTYHPTPELTPISNSPLCRGERLTINFKSNLPVSNLAQKILTHNGVTVDRYREESDRIIYEKDNVQLSDTGTYRFHVTTTQSCSTESEIRFKVDTVVPVKIVANAPINRFCEGEQTLLTADIAQIGNQSYIYKWFIKTPEEQPLPGSNESTQLITWSRMLNDQWVYVRVKPNNCYSSDSIKATVLAIPQLGNMPKDTGICVGNPFYLDPTADVVPQMVVWYYMDDNDVTEIRQRGAALSHHIESVDLVNAGRYFFAAENDGCIAYSDTTRLTVYPLPEIIGIEGPSFICDGSTITLKAVADKDGDGGVYWWQHSGEQTAQVVINQKGTYTVRYTSVKGCTSKDTAVNIEGRETPRFQLPNDTSICRGTSFVIVGPEGLDAYQWQDGSTDKDRLVEKDGLYILTGYKNECSYSDSLVVKMTFCGQFHIPTAFTPNGNGINDLWGAISSAKDEDMSEFDLMVFDRDGRVLFHGKKISDRWDGRYKGKMCPPAVYPFTLRALEKFEGIRYQASGTVTIVQ